jgi:hypothetical protein
MKNGNSVASAQYSDKCKIFIFPKDFLKASWVEKFEFSTLNKDLDLAFFLIYKKGEGSEAKIVPEPMVMEVGRAYKLINCEGKIKEKPINVEILKVNFIQTKNSRRTRVQRSSNRTTLRVASQSWPQTMA